MRETLKGLVAAVAWSALWILPLPFGTFVSDRIFFTSLSPLLLGVLILTVPPWLRRRDMRLFGKSVYPPTGLLIYATVVALLFGTAFLGALRSTEFWQSYPSRVGVYTLWMIVMLMGQAVMGRIFFLWHDKVRKRSFSDFIDPLFYALPIPAGMSALFFFPVVKLDGVQAQETFALGLIGLFFFINTVVYFTFIIGTFAFYFYPKEEAYPTLSLRMLGLVRVIFAVCLFFFVQAFVNGATGLYAFELTHLTMRNNVLVFILPALTYALFIVISIACTIGIFDLFIPFIRIKLRKKKRCL